MKKIIAIALVLALGACLFVGCNNSGDNGTTSTPAATEPVQTPAATEPVQTPAATEPVDTPADTPVDTPADTPADTEPVVDTPAPTEPEETYPEIPAATDGIQDDVASDIF